MMIVSDRYTFFEVFDRCAISGKHITSGAIFNVFFWLLVIVTVLNAPLAL